MPQHKNNNQHIKLVQQITFNAPNSTLSSKLTVDLSLIDRASAILVLPIIDLFDKAPSSTAI